MEKKSRRAIVVLFWIYAVLMLWLMFGQRLLWADYDTWFDNYRTELLERLNLAPFETIGGFIRSLSRAWTAHAFTNLFGNVLMFLPLGFFLPHVCKKARKLFGCIIVAFLTILCAEVIQLFTLLGFFDVDDLILNMVGVVAGFWLSALFDRYICRSK